MSNNSEPSRWRCGYVEPEPGRPTTITLSPAQQAISELMEELRRQYPRASGESRLDWEVRLIGIRNQRLKELRDDKKNAQADDRQTPRSGT